MAREVMAPINAHRRKMQEDYDRNRTKLRQNWGRSAQYWIELRRADEKDGWPIEDSPRLESNRNDW